MAIERTKHRPELYVDGKWTSLTDQRDGVLVCNPATEEVICSLGQAGPEQVDAAIAAARRTFASGVWRDRAPADRGAVLSRVAEELHLRRPAIEQAMSQEQGISPAVAAGAVDQAIKQWRQYAELVESFEWITERPLDEQRKAVMTYAAVGVVLAITPWNGPLGIATLKLAPALAAGCSVVLKPASECPLTIPLLTEAIRAGGVPDGVVGAVFADAAVSGATVARADIDMVSFTGSTAVGARIMEACAANLTRVALELGGKSAAIVLRDAEPSEVMPHLIVAAGLRNAGQVCTSRSRIIVPRSRRDAWVDAIKEALEALRLGDPREPTSTMGPLITSAHRQRVETYIEQAIAEGATLVTGGGRPAHPQRGWFLEPTLFADVTPEMRIAQEEIFGPVLAVLEYDDVDEAIAIAEATEYGLAGSVFTSDDAAGWDVALRVRTGTFQVNVSGRALDQAFGGFKKSGIGREGGIEGLLEFLEVRQIQVPTA
jgi:aldehyde dehydrogenase (NAD+)